MQKYVSSVLFFLLTTAAFSALAQFTLSAGVQSSTMNVNSEMSIDNVSGSETEGSASTQEVGISGELATGYQFNLDKTYNIALEIFGQLVDTDTQVPVFVGDGVALNDNHAKASFNWIAGLRLRPGYYFTPATRVFIDFGIVWGNFEVEYSEGLQSGLQNFAFDLPGIPGKNEIETLGGWRYGAGLEYKFTDVFVMGLDYTITEFDELTADKAQDAFDAAYGATTITYTPTLNTLGLNFKYLFGAKQAPQRNYLSDK